MNDTLSQAPEIPDPTQLDLFDCPTSDDETLDSTVSDGTPAVVERQSRDPTPNEHRENLNASQSKLASVLYLKSRALASKLKPIEAEE